MFCTNCGAQLADGAKFCTSCGTALGTGAANAAPAAAAPATSTASIGVATKKPINKRVILIAAAVVVVAIAVVLIIVLTGGKGGAGSTDAVVKAYMTAFEKEDEDAILDLFLPEYVDLYVSISGSKKSDFLEENDPFYEGYGTKLKSWEIVDTEKEEIDDSDELEMIESMLGVKIQAGATVEAEAKVRIDGETEEVSFFFNLIKVKSKWYIVGMDD